MTQKIVKGCFCLLGSCMLVLGTVSAGQAMGRIPKKEYQAKVAELKKSNQELNSLQKDLVVKESRIEELEANNSRLLQDMKSGKSQLQKNIAKLRKEKQEAEEEKAKIEKEKATEVKKLKSTYDSLVSDMEKEIEQGSIQITQLQNKLSVNLIDKILFNSGESEVNKQGKKVLAKVANILKKVQNKQIRIEGHTDNIPIGGALKDLYPSNWELSTARATTVTRYLQDVGGINPKVLSATGYADYRPIADNSTAKGRSKNRRIEIVLVPIEMTSSAQASEKPGQKE